MNLRSILDFWLRVLGFSQPQDSSPADSAPAILALQITEPTVLKRRPFLSRELLSEPDQCSLAPDRFSLQSYADESGAESLKGHVQVTLQTPLQGHTTWYVWSQHCQIWRGGHKLYPPEHLSQRLAINRWSWRGFEAAVNEPYNGDALINRGVIIFSGVNPNFDGDSQRALEHFQVAAEIDPDLAAEAHYRQGLIHAVKFYELFTHRDLEHSAQAEEPAWEQAAQQATTQFAAALEQDPTYIQAYVERGVLYYRWQNYEAAIADFTQAIQLNSPDTPELLFRRAAAYEQLENPDAALADYRQVVQGQGGAIAPADLTPPQQLMFYRGLASFYGRQWYGREDEDFDSVFYPHAYRVAEQVTAAIDVTIAIPYPDDSAAERQRQAELAQLQDHQPQTAPEYLSRGLQRRRLEDWSGARQDFEAALASEPTWAEAHYQLGISTDNSQQAISHLTEAIQHRPDFAFAYLRRAIQRLSGRPIGDLFLTESVLYQQQDVFQIESDTYDAAMADFDQAVQLQPDLALAFYERGRSRFYSRGFIAAELEQALADYWQAVRINPFFDLAYETPAMGSRDFLEQLQPDPSSLAAALAPLNAQLSQQPQSLDAHLQKARLLYEASHLQEAVDALSHLLHHHPEAFEGYEKRGVARYRLQQYPAAIADLDQTLAAQPNQADAYAVRALAHFELGAHAEALQDTQRAIWLHPFHIQAHLLLIQLHHSLGTEALPPNSTLASIQWVILKGWEFNGKTFGIGVGGGSYSQSRSRTRRSWR